LSSYLSGGNFDGIIKTKPRVYFTKEYSDATDVTFQNEFTQAIISTACKWSQTRPTYLVRPIPEMANDVSKTLSRKILFNRGNDDIKIPLNEYQLVTNSFGKHKIKPLSNVG
jgi:hypothetical protein